MLSIFGTLTKGTIQSLTIKFVKFRLLNIFSIFPSLKKNSSVLSSSSVIPSPLFASTATSFSFLTFFSSISSSSPHPLHSATTYVFVLHVFNLVIFIILISFIHLHHLQLFLRNTGRALLSSWSRTFQDVWLFLLRNLASFCPTPFTDHIRHLS